MPSVRDKIPLPYIRFSQNSACYVIANDEDQASDDLDLAHKLIAANPTTLGAELVAFAKEIRRKNGKGRCKYCLRAAVSARTVKHLITVSAAGMIWS